MQPSLFHKSFSLSQQQLILLLGEYQSLDHFMWLDSASLGHQNNHFSVCAWQPKTLLSTSGERTTISRLNDQGSPQDLIESTDDPLALIQQALIELPIQSKPDNFELPFWGGAIGYWGYELGGRFEKLPTPKPTEVDLPDMAVGIFDIALVIEHTLTQELSDQTTNEQSPSAPPHNESIVTLHFVSQASQSRTQQELSVLTERIEQIQAMKLSSSSTITTDQNAKAKPFTLISNWSANMTQVDYAQKFEKVQSYLRSGDCYQINLAQRFSASYEGDEWQAYLALRDTNKAPFSSFIRLTNGAVLSLSPERFLEVKDRQVETKPIKGTRPRSKTPSVDTANANDLACASKDRAENLMIVDLLRNDLSKVSVPGSVQVPSLFAIESYPAVHHLVSTITSILKPGALSVDLLRGAFPGGSITGAPKIRAMEIIHELEPHPRNVYCGAIGYIKPDGDMDTNITIRTLACNKNKIYCWAGGGLVADSVCDAEYQETLDKVNKILPILENLNKAH